MAMVSFKTFGEYLEQRTSFVPNAGPSRADGGGTGANFTEYPLPDPGIPGDGRHVSERSRFRNPYKVVSGAVNPSRPVSPTNSRLLSFPARKRLKSQIVGR